jgi:hypothetical protein
VPDGVVYLYAICSDPGRAVACQLTGVAGATVRVIRHGDLAVVVSTVTDAEFGELALKRNLEDMAWVEALVRAHHDVVQAIAWSAPTAPGRAATVFRDDDRVLEVLRDREAELHVLLGRLTGHREWGVKIHLLPPAASGEDLQDLAAGGTSGPGTAYLLRRKAADGLRQESERRLADQVRQIDSSLAALAAATHHRPQDFPLTRKSGVVVLNAAYLVPAADTARFTAAADELGGGLTGARLTVTGPWPAYSFASLPELS